MLRIRMRGLWPAVALAISLFAAAGFGCVAAFLLHGRAGLLLAIAAYVSPWVVAEVVGSIVLFTYARFTPVQRDGNQPDNPLQLTSGDHSPVDGSTI